MVRRTNKPARSRAGFFVFWMVLLVPPAVAVLQPRFPLPCGLFAIAAAVVSLAAFLTERFDKRRAEAGGWRVPEFTLHVMELLGGWPGALLAQQLYRHKTAKLSYQVVFWLIVVVHEYLAVDFLLGWQIALWLA